MEEGKSVLRERAGVFAIYLVILFINAFVDLGHKIIIQNTTLLEKKAISEKKTIANKERIICHLNSSK